MVVVGLNGGALIPSRTRKLQIGQILRRLPISGQHQNLFNKTKLTYIVPRDEMGMGASRGGPSGYEGVKGWPFRVRGGQGVGLKGPRR